MKRDVLVIGAGFAGCTAARVLAEKGKKVIVVEKERFVGGHCHDYRNELGIMIHSAGPHIFHTKNKYIWDFVNRFSPFRTYQHRVLSYVNGFMVNFPINRDTIAKIYGVDLAINQVRSFLDEEIKKSVFNDPPENFRDVVVSQVGETLYELLYKNYTIKQWKRDPEELSPEVARRIPVRENRDERYFTDQYQGIPWLGYTGLMEKMLDHPNISMLMGANYNDVAADITADFTVYTGSLDAFFRYEYGKLQYRSCFMDFHTVDQEFYQPVSQVNYPNDYDFVRITEFKHFLGEKSPKTTICFEYPVETGKPYYVVLTPDNMAIKHKYEEEVKKLEATGKYAFIGRLAEYKYYNMDEVIASSMKKIGA